MSILWFIRLFIKQEILLFEKYIDTHVVSLDYWNIYKVTLLARLHRNYTETNKGLQRHTLQPLDFMVPPAGIGPAAPGLGIHVVYHFKYSIIIRIML